MSTVDPKIEGNLRTSPGLFFGKLLDMSEHPNTASVPQAMLVVNNCSTFRRSPLNPEHREALLVCKKVHVHPELCAFADEQLSADWLGFCLHGLSRAWSKKRHDHHQHHHDRHHHHPQHDYVSCPLSSKTNKASSFHLSFPCCSCYPYFVSDSGLGYNFTEGISRHKNASDGGKICKCRCRAYYLLSPMCL